MLKIKKHFQQTQIILKHGKEVLIENKDIAVKKAIDYGLVCLFQYLMTQSYDFLLCDNTCYNLFIIRGGSGALRVKNLSYIMNICVLPLQYVKTLISLPFTLIVMLHLFYQLFNHYHRCTTIIKNKTHIFLLECDVNGNYIYLIIKRIFHRS